MTTVLLSIQAKEIIKTGPSTTQDSIVSTVSKQVPPYKGTYVSKSFVNSRIQSWQAHLERISLYLEHGGVWWQAAEGGYTFFDSDGDSEYNSHGPDLMHFRTSCIQLVYKLSQEKWLSIIEKKTVLPTSYIRLFKDGVYDGRRYFPSCNEETEMETDTGKIPGQAIQPLSKQKSWILPKIRFKCQIFKINYLVHNPLLQLDKLQKVLTHYIL